MDVSISGDVTRTVVVEEPTQVGQARREAQAMALRLGFNETDCGRVALAASELASNLLRHGGGGRLFLSVVQGHGQRGIDIHTVDAGPGFVLAQGLVEGYSTAGSQGLGLGAVRRQAHVLDAWSDERGSVVMARIFGADAPARVDVRYGALRLPMRGEQRCGDAWHLAVSGGEASVTLMDGLGHGPSAADAAQAGMDVAAARGVDAPDRTLSALHAGMTGTRGAAVAVARVAVGGGALAYAGIGNIAGALLEADAVRGLVSLPGIVGVQCRRVQSFQLNAAPGSLLVLHSDGLQGRWRLQAYPGLQHRHPALVVAVLLRDFDRGRDDVCVFALRLGGP